VFHTESVYMFMVICSMKLHMPNSNDHSFISYCYKTKR